MFDKAGLTLATSSLNIDPTEAWWTGAAATGGALVTMSALNGDKARFNRQRKQKLAKRERNRVLRKRLTASAPRRPSGRDL